LGFVPSGLALAALEISRPMLPGEAVARHPQLRGWCLILSGDAHRLSEMRANTLITMGEPSIRELEKALGGEDGRAVELVL